MADRPKWMQFDFDDFCGDPNVLLCPLDTQGWYMHLLRAMTRCSPYGCLSVGGVEPPPMHLAKMTAYHWQTCRHHLSILKANGVLKQGADGIWYNERMVQDYAKYQESKANGEKGAETRWGGKSDSPPHKAPPMTIEKKRIEKNKNKKDMSGDAPFVSEFENVFWPPVRKKETKADTLRLFVSLRKKGIPLATLISGLLQYQQAKADDNADDDIKYLMQPARFLGPGRHWEEWAQKAEVADAERQRSKEASERREKTVLKRTVQPVNPNPEMAKQLRELARDLGEDKAIEGEDK